MLAWTFVLYVHLCWYINVLVRHIDVCVCVCTWCLSVLCENVHIWVDFKWWSKCVNKILSGCVHLSIPVWVMVIISICVSVLVYTMVCICFGCYMCYCMKWVPEYLTVCFDDEYKVYKYMSKCATSCRGYGYMHM